MRRPISPSRSAVFPTRAVAVLTALAGALGAALVFAPGILATRGRNSDLADRRNLVDDLRDAFIGYWHSGKEQYSPDLERVVDYWFRYNVVKGVIATVLLIVLVALGSLLWKTFLRDGGPERVRRVALVSAGVSVVGFALFALWTAVASLQGAAAPFASILPLLGGASHGALADTVDQIKQHLTDSTGRSEQARPALEGIVSDYVRFHVVREIAAVPIALVFMGASVVLWKKYARKGSTDRRTRRVLVSFAVSSTVLSLFFILIFAVNRATAADPDPGLLNFFNGSW
ncbi:hypothetical protein OG625_07910 [Streptomyces sp. NBC_01351]|uniref:hypothetical protein n=1 Tax=Streptomyces sp. NBC_01351 TaxID=2903833 RepID=UPI002E338472|nr:hypothetical protein [Streptomyces sp. NBC_01351]